MLEAERDGQNQLAEIARRIQSLIDNPNSTLSREWLLEMGRSNSLAVLGAIAYLILRGDLIMRIAPPLPLEEQQLFLMRYWERCLFENPKDDEFVGGRYVSAGEILGWFRSLWKDRSVDRNLPLRVKIWLADVYKRGGDDVRTSIVQGILEHLLQDREIRQFFADWKRDSHLGEAYKEATG